MTEPFENFETAEAEEPKLPETIVGFFFENYVDIIKLNLLFLLFCIPIITIPAACTAASYISYRIVTGQRYTFWEDFRRRFCGEFTKSLLCGLVYAVLFALILVPLTSALRAVFGAFSLSAALTAAALLFCLGFCFSAAAYTFALLGIVQLSPVVVLLNSVRLALARPMAGAKSFLFFVFLTAAMILTFPFTLPFLFFLYFGPIIFINIYEARDGIQLCIVPKKTDAEQA